ncbi:hypothetical protein CHH51_18575, partial [Terribacillus saccharophilus]
MLTLSVFNDNKMFIFTLIIYLSIFFFMEFAVYLTLAKLRRVVTMTSIIVFGAIILYFSSQQVNEEVNNVFSLINNFNLSGEEQSGPDKHNERAYLNYLAFNYYDGYELGIGLDKVDINNNSIHVHLGINSFSLITITGGFILLIAIINLYSVLILES